MQPEQERRRRVGIGRLGGELPVLAHLRAHLHLAGELIPPADRHEIAVVGKRRADVLVVAVPGFKDADQPIAERVIDFDIDIAAKLAGCADQRRFVYLRDRAQPDARRPRWLPEQRAVGDHAVDVLQRRILVLTFDYPIAISPVSEPNRLNALPTDTLAPFESRSNPFISNSWSWMRWSASTSMNGFKPGSSS